jgi:hypothetical protein
MKLYNLKRNIGVWSIVTLLSAAPSFMIALHQKIFVLPMCFGVIIVMVAYFIASSSEFWHNISLHKKHFAKSLKIAFIIRITASIFFLLHYIMDDTPNRNELKLFGIIDVCLGLCSLSFTELFFSSSSNFKAVFKTDFMVVLFTTLVQALLVSITILFIAFIIWCYIRVTVYLKSSKLTK